jgi:hypothetical protein
MPKFLVFVLIFIPRINSKADPSFRTGFTLFQYFS